MKKTGFMILAAAIMGFTAPVIAADQPAPAAGVTFGVVDLNKVMQATDAAKDIFSQLESKRKEYQAQISKEEDALRAAEQEIIKQRDTLSKEEFEKRRAGFEEKIIQGQKMVQGRKRTLDQAFNGATGVLRREVAKIVSEVAREKNYSAVLTQEAVMMAAPALDITDIVIERMNKRVKKIPVEWKADAGEDAPTKTSKNSKKK